VRNKLDNSWSPQVSLHGFTCSSSLHMSCYPLNIIHPSSPTHENENPTSHNFTADLALQSVHRAAKANMCGLAQAKKPTPTERRPAGKAEERTMCAAERTRQNSRQHAWLRAGQYAGGEESSGQHADASGRLKASVPDCLPVNPSRMHGNWSINPLLQHGLSWRPN
jgi:hypothetical protein